MTGWIQKSGEIARMRTAPPDAHDAQLSIGPIGASIRVREPRSKKYM